MKLKTQPSVIFLIALLGVATVSTFWYQHTEQLKLKKTVVDLQAKKDCNYASTLEKVKNGTYRVLRSDGGHGTGFALTNNGLVVTNNHVIKGAKKITVWADGNKEASVVATIPEDDIALLQIDFVTQRVPFIDSKSLNIADSLYTMGWPIYKDEDSTISRGIYSRRFWSDRVEVLQTDIPVNPGNSGGPIITDCGVVGMITSKEVWLDESTPVEGMSYAISSYTIARDLKKYLDKDIIDAFIYLR